jgi:hypothetical protein
MDWLPPPIRVQGEWERDSVLSVGVAVGVISNILPLDLNLKY